MNQHVRSILAACVLEGVSGIGMILCAAPLAEGGISDTATLVWSGLTCFFMIVVLCTAVLICDLLYFRVGGRGPNGREPLPRVIPAPVDLRGRAISIF